MTPTKRAKPRVRVHAVSHKGYGVFSLVDHPGVLPIGFGELQRLGSTVGVLRERVKIYEAREKQLTYKSTDELPAPRTQEALMFQRRAMIHRNAIRHFQQAED